MKRLDLTKVPEFVGKFRVRGFLRYLYWVDDTIPDSSFDFSTYKISREVAIQNHNRAFSMTEDYAHLNIIKRIEKTEDSYPADMQNECGSVGCIIGWVTACPFVPVITSLRIHLAGPAVFDDVFELHKSYTEGLFYYNNTTSVMNDWYITRESKDAFSTLGNIERDATKKFALDRAAKFVDLVLEGKINPNKDLNARSASDRNL